MKKTTKKTGNNQDKIYQMVTDRVAELLEKGVVPWQKPWAGGGHPANFISKKDYRGINTFLLGASGFSSRYWLSFKQVKSKGGTVKKGEHGSPCIFWKWIDLKETDETDKPKKIPFMRYYTVFNLEQTTGIDIPEVEKRDLNPIAVCEKTIIDMPNAPFITHKESQAYYRPAEDTVNMPKSNLFRSDSAYYSTLFHELTHSTGHANRLDRHANDNCSHHFGSTDYSKEELVAEMGAAFLCGHCEIERETIDNSAAYIQSWLKRLRDDRKFLVSAAAKAQKAVDYILDRKFN